MRRVIVLALLAMALPIAAWGSGIDFTNDFGSVTVSTSGISTVGSELLSFNGTTAPPNHSLGTVSFSTGALISGTIAGGGTFDSAGSSFVIIGKGLWAKGYQGFSGGQVTLFSGSFVGPITWTKVGQVGQHVEYQLSGTIVGTLWTGRTVTGTTTQNIFSSVRQLQGGIGHISPGGGHFNTPEPGTLGLLGTGLVGIAGLFRRKMSA